MNKTNDTAKAMKELSNKMHQGYDMAPGEPHIHSQKVGLTRGQQRTLVLTVVFLLIFNIVTLLAAIDWKKDYEDLLNEHEDISSQLVLMEEEINKLSSEKIMLQKELEESKK
jgi:hypothetical protein